MFMGRCDYCLIALETGNICPTCSETVKLKEPPTSETERLLAGSLAIAELAALRKTAKEYGEWLEERAKACFCNAEVAHRSASTSTELWRARGTCYHEAANKLKELLGEQK